MNRRTEESTWPAAVLTSAFCPDFDAQRLAMAICVGYFETSTEPGTFTVSGYLSSKTRWRQFETQWTRALRREDLAAFNGHDFVHQTHGFSVGWSDLLRRRRLMEVLTRVTEQHVFRAFSCSVQMVDYNQVNAEYPSSDFVPSPYGVCAGILMAKVRRWMCDRHPDDLTLFVFEEGNIDHRELRRITAAVEGDQGEPPQLWPRQWFDERGRRRHLRPFEACDLLGSDGDASFVSRLQARSRFDRDVLDRERLVRIARALDISRLRGTASRAGTLSEEPASRTA
jgi:hypothetical protein